MKSEFIELANTVLAEFAGLIFNQLHKVSLSDEERVVYGELKNAAYYDKNLLYVGDENDRNRVFNRVNSFYAPFLKKHREIEQTHKMRNTDKSVKNFIVAFKKEKMIG